MKKITIILFILFITNNIISQDTFEFIIEDSLSSFCFTTFNESQGYFVSVGSTSDPDTYKYDGLMVKFKNEDNITTKVFHKQDTSIAFSFGFQMPNGNYFVAGRIDDDVDIYLKNLYLMVVSPELEILSENIYGIPPIYNGLSLVNLFVDSDSIVIINGNLDEPSSGWTGDLYMAKLNIQGEMLDSMSSSNQYVKNNWGSKLLKKNDGTGYYLVGEFSACNMVKFDNDLNITGIIPMDPDNSYTFPLSARWLSNDRMIIASLALQDVGSFFDLRLRVSDTSLNAIKDTIIIDDGENVLPAINGLDFIDKNNIWVATYPQLGKSFNDWEFGRIYIVDENLNVKGSKYFGGMSQLYLFSLKALEDGGCILTGIIPNDTNSSNKNVYFKKVMPDDILTNAEETPTKEDRDVLLYPVPFQDRLFVETYRKNLSISLYSTEGKYVVIKSRLNIPNTRIQTSDLNKGTYIYSVSDGNKIIQTGKLIKN